MGRGVISFFVERMDCMKEKIFLSSPHMSDEGYEMTFIQDAFESNWIAPLGENVECFEKEMVNKIGSKDAVALSSGTAAIHLALKHAGVKKNDYVFCQSLTFSASAFPILYEQAIPVFIDSEKYTWNMSPEALESALLFYENKGRKPKAVIVVHLYGIAAKILEIRKICNKFDVILIEDAAESLGTLVNNQYTGTFGDYGILSFNGNKIITTSGGGMLLCNTEDAHEKAAKTRFWATQSKEKEIFYEHREIGYNYRMSNVVAGIGRGQLKILDQRVRKKREIFQTYKTAFADIKELKMMPFDRNDTYQNCWLSVAQICSDRVKPENIIVALEKENIESRLVWKPMHRQPIFSNYDYIDSNHTSDILFKQGICLPSDTKLTNSQQEEIIDIVKRLWK